MPELTTPALHIAFGVDHNYVPPMAAAIQSIITRNPNLAIVFHVLASDLTPQDKEKLSHFAAQKNIALRLCDVDTAKLSRLPDPRAYTSAIYNRFLLCEMLDGIADKVLYLDADIICLGDISPLLTLPMGNCILAAVGDVEQQKRKANAHITGDQPYFNSGVLFIDVVKWNTRNITRTLLDTMEKNRAHYAMPDQDALNDVLAGSVTFLNQNWNLLFDHFPVTADTVFLHYAGGKPWQCWVTPYNHQAFVTALAQTPWAQWRYTPTNRKQKNKLAQHYLAKGNILRAVYWYGQFLFSKRKTGT